MATVMPMVEAAMPEQDIPIPVLMNVLKHHRECLRRLIAHAVSLGHEGIPALAETLLILGDNLMDFYVGELSVAEVSTLVLQSLATMNVLDAPTFEHWVSTGGGYRVVTLDAHDQSNWVLRVADDEVRYVHVHPGRWSPATFRVRATNLKTAVLSIAQAQLTDADPFDVTHVNAVRTTYLDLSPIAKVLSGQGIAKVMEALL